MPLESQDDPELVRLTLAGRPEAFGILYDRYGQDIHRFHLRRTGGRHHETDDLTQQTFVKALEGLRGYRGDAPFRAWLFAIARNELLDWTARKVAVELVEECEASPASSPEDRVITEQHRAALLIRLKDVLGSLKDPRKRRLFEMVALEGRPQNEVARIMDVSHDACRQAYTRLRKEIAGALAPLARERAAGS